MNIGILNLQLNSFNKNQISYGSKRIFPVVVRDMQDRPIKAWFSRLNPSDPNDKAAMYKVEKEWSEHEKRINAVYILARGIYYDFIQPKGRTFYAIELDKPSKPLYDRLLCLSSCRVKDAQGNFYIELLQSAPNSSSDSPRTRKYKGAGNALMYSMVRTAQKLKSNMFTLDSVNHEFYEKLGLKLRNYVMTFNPAEMKEFTKRVEADWKELLSIKHNK